PCPRRSRQIVDRQPVLARMLQRPEDQRQLRRRGLQQQREINVERAESNAETTQLCTAGLVERLQFLGDRLPLQNSEALSEAESNPARQPGKILSLAELHERLKALTNRVVEPSRQALLDFLLVRRLQVLIRY